MVNDIPMGNASFISTFFSFSPIESIPFWARQMFEVIEQKLNEQTIQMAKFKKEQAIDKAELKKKIATQIVEFRTILLKSKAPPTPITTPVFPVAFPTPAFTFSTERKKKIPEATYILWNPKKNQPWYFQVRAKLQVDFTH